MWEDNEQLSVHYLKGRDWLEDLVVDGRIVVNGS
jgi:hypothetical protein